jgi:hypothetical protein
MDAMHGSRRAAPITSPGQESASRLRSLPRGPASPSAEYGVARAEAIRDDRSRLFPREVVRIVVSRVYPLVTRDSILPVVRCVRGNDELGPDSAIVASPEDVTRLKAEFRRKYGHDGRIVSVGLGRDGSHRYLRVLVNSKYPLTKMPRTFRGLPVLVRRTSSGAVALGQASD